MLTRIRLAALGALEDVLPVALAAREPLRELQQNRAELARLVQRRERAEEAVPHVVDGRRRAEVLEVDTGFFASSGRSAFGSAAIFVGCWVSSENALTSKTKPSGVRSAHSALLRSLGSE